jgi:4-diphosphocytidyl-2-C-methyl-D-erythritol kinase
MMALPDRAGFAPAKVNLTLRVVGRRADGYHLLDSLVVFAGIGDRLTVRPSAGLSLRVTGPFGADLAGEADNLVLRAARRLAEAAGIGAHGALTLEKNLPLASGIGGGSADAAAALRLLAAYWDLGATDETIGRLALELGADVPVCVARRPARMGGIGEVLAPVDALPRLGLVLVNPGVGCSTPAVFRARAAAGAAFSAMDAVPRGAVPTPAALAAALAESGNDLEAAAIALAPAIGEVLAALRGLPGCLLARMSGSGATCFGLFADADAAAGAAGAVRRTGWWCWGGGLYEPAPAAL